VPVEEPSTASTTEVRLFDHPVGAAAHRYGIGVLSALAVRG
jgi:hypothetical protein